MQWFQPCTISVVFLLRVDETVRYTDTFKSSLSHCIAGLLNQPVISGVESSALFDVEEGSLSFDTF